MSRFRDGPSTTWPTTPRPRSRYSEIAPTAPAKCWTVWRRPGGRPQIKPWPIPTGGARTDHHRRLRLRRRGRHADLPQRGGPHADPKIFFFLKKKKKKKKKNRNVVFGAICPELPIAGQVHHLGVGPHRARPPARDVAAPPPTTRPGSGLPAHLPRRKRPLVERSIAWLTRGNPPGPLPRHRQEQLPGSTTGRCPEPASPAGPWPGHRRTVAGGSAEPKPPTPRRGRRPRSAIN